MDYSKLGVREVTYTEVESVTDPKTGVNSLVPRRKTRLERQSLLTLEEAKTLGPSQEWKPLGGEWTTSVVTGDGKRRFICKVDPFADERGKTKPAVVVQSDPDETGDDVTEKAGKRPTKRGRTVDSDKS